MNIKTIHLIFIGVSTILAFFFAVWSWGYSQQEGHGAYKAVAVVSGLIGVGLIGYAAYFVRKAKSL